MLTILANVFTAFFVVYFAREFWKRTAFTGEARWIWSLLCGLSFGLVCKLLAMAFVSVAGVFLRGEELFVGAIIATIAALGLSVVGVMIVFDRVLPSVKSATS